MGKLHEFIVLNDVSSSPPSRCTRAPPPVSLFCLSLFIPLPLSLALAPIFSVRFSASIALTSLASNDPQYPASGLLLRDEFRTFIEVESEGERVYEPVEPLVRLLKNFGIADGAGSTDGIAKKQLYETLVMRVTVPAHSRSWGINICPKNHKNFEEILFHFNPRRRFVAMNNRESNIWGQQVLLVPLAQALLIRVQRAAGGKADLLRCDSSCCCMHGSQNRPWYYL